MSFKNTPQKSGKITFVQNNLPPLKDGEYMITVEQAVKNTDTSVKPGDKAYVNESYANTRRFAVQGDRFTLDSTLFKTCFPPENSQGEYDNVLAHVVLTRKTLPWERSPDNSNDSNSWLALLLFTNQDPPPDIKNIMVGDLQRQDFPHEQGASPSASNLPDTTASYADADSNFGLDYGENWYDQCLAIDVPVSLFSETVPGVVDLPWLAHARKVTPDPAAQSPLAESAAQEIDSSVVVGNRLPDPKSKCTVHLVSIENMGNFLPTGDDYTPVDIKTSKGKTADHVRLVTLKHWSFTSVDPDQTFTGILKNLDKDDNLRVFQIKDDDTGGTDADKYVANSLKLGYTAVNHHTRQGANTVSWYRGPFVPFNVPDTIVAPIPDPDTDPMGLPIMTADEAVRYDPDNGMMDVSYAAAWQIGRLLALQDQQFSVTLYNWKHDNTLKTALAAERQILEENLGDALELTQEYMKSEPAFMHHAIARFVAGNLKPHISDPTDPDDEGAPGGKDDE